jgi:hypothetical protein
MEAAVAPSSNRVIVERSMAANSAAAAPGYSTPLFWGAVLSTASVMWGCAGVEAKHASHG